MRVVWKTRNFQVERAVPRVVREQLPLQPPPWISVTTNHAWCMVNACRGRIVTSATVTPGTPATTARSTMVDLVDISITRGLCGIYVGRADSYPTRALNGNIMSQRCNCMIAWWENISSCYRIVTRIFLWTLGEKMSQNYYKLNMNNKNVKIKYRLYKEMFK